MFWIIFNKLFKPEVPYPLKVSYEKPGVKVNVMVTVVKNIFDKFRPNYKSNSVKVHANFCIWQASKSVYGDQVHAPVYIK